MKGFARILALAAVLLFPLTALANDYTTVTATVTDPNGSVYSAGSATITFLPADTSIQYSFGGVPLATSSGFTSVISIDDTSNTLAKTCTTTSTAGAFAVTVGTTVFWVPYSIACT